MTPNSVTDSEYESVMPQTQLEKEKQQYNDILVHTFPDSEEEISARKFPIPTDSIPYGKSCLGKDESIS